MMVDTETAQLAAARQPLVERLESAGLAATQQRLDIAAILFARDGHFSAEQVLDQLLGGGCRVSKATVYNTLNVFANRGLLRQVFVDPTRVFFDSNTRPHHHLFDVDSGELHDFDTGLVAVAGLPELPPDTEVEMVDVVVRVRRGERRPAQ